MDSAGLAQCLITTIVYYMALTIGSSNNKNNQLTNKTEPYLI